MNYLLIIGIIYAISTPLVFFCMANREEEAPPSMMQKAANNFPGFKPLFTIADKLYRALHSPGILIVMLIAIPVLLFQEYFSKKKYSDPCFQIIPDHVLETAQRLEFEEYRQELDQTRFRSVGLFKYRQQKLTELVEYFVSKSGTALAVYCLHGKFQICIVDFSVDGVAVVTSGLPEEIYSSSIELESNAKPLIRRCINSTDVKTLLHEHDSK
jgi:hypothetical protein